MNTSFDLQRQLDELEIETNERLMQQYRAGVAEGHRQANAMVARATFWLLSLGIAIGAVLTVAVVGWLA